MRKIKRILFGVSFFIFVPVAFSWNTQGHEIIAQIAYDNLTTKAKADVQRYNQAINKVYHPKSFIKSAAWLDEIRWQGNHWYDGFHYIDMPFSDDGTSLSEPQKVNAAWAIEQAIDVLRNPRASHFDKGFALRVLLHSTGDLHQPLHATTRVNKAFPDGDKGGNLIKLKKNFVAKTLHAYWDRGAGYLLGKGDKRRMKKARYIAQRYPCGDFDVTPRPSAWADASRQLAIEHAYPGHHLLDASYQRVAIEISQKQLAASGCRIAAFLNSLE